MPQSHTPRRLRWALVTLCVTVTTSYGVLFYAFPVLAPAISADTGWSLPWLTAAYSVGQLVTAGCGPLVGRWLDRAGPRPVMTTGSLLGAPAVLGVAYAPGLGWFMAAWVAMGMASAMLFYPPAFAALTRWYGERRVGALTALTLVAGFASTIFAPLSAYLEDALGWRGAYVALAVILASVTVLPHVLMLTPRWPQQAPMSRAQGRAEIRAVVTGRAFLTLAGSFALCAFAIYGMVVHLVPLMAERGIDTQTAAWAVGLGGVGQVVGRFAYAPLARALTLIPRTVAILGACAATTALLALLPGPVGALMAAAFLAGAARGIFTLLEATAISDRWGATHYGTLNGILHTPLLGAIALAPWGGSVLAAALGGYPALFLLLSAGAGLGVLLSLFSRPRSV